MVVKPPQQQQQSVSGDLSIERGLGCGPLQLGSKVNAVLPICRSLEPHLQVICNANNLFAADTLIYLSSLGIQLSIGGYAQRLHLISINAAPDPTSLCGGDAELRARIITFTYNHIPLLRPSKEAPDLRAIYQLCGPTVPGIYVAISPLRHHSHQPDHDQRTQLSRPSLAAAVERGGGGGFERVEVVELRQKQQQQQPQERDGDPSAAVCSGQSVEESECGGASSNCETAATAAAFVWAGNRQQQQLPRKQKNRKCAVAAPVELITTTTTERQHSSSDKKAPDAAAAAAASRSIVCGLAPEQPVGSPAASGKESGYCGDEQPQVADDDDFDDDDGGNGDSALPPRQDGQKDGERDAMTTTTGSAADAGVRSDLYYFLSYAGLSFRFPIPAADAPALLAAWEEESDVLPFTLPVTSARLGVAKAPVVDRILIFPEHADPRTFIFGLPPTNPLPPTTPLPLTSVPLSLHPRHTFPRNVSVEVSLDRGILRFASGRTLALGCALQDAYTELGPPDCVNLKALDVVSLLPPQTRKGPPLPPTTAAPQHSRHAYAAVSAGGSKRPDNYFCNYFGRGIDFLVDGISHRVRKIILHTNLPRHCLFGVYSRCFFQICLSSLKPQTLQPNQAVLQIDSKWPDIRAILGPSSAPLLVSDDSGGLRKFYGYPGLVIEVHERIWIASVTLF